MNRTSIKMTKTVLIVLTLTVHIYYHAVGASSARENFPVQEDHFSSKGSIQPIVQPSPRGYEPNRKAGLEPAYEAEKLKIPVPIIPEKQRHSSEEGLIPRLGNPVNIEVNTLHQSKTPVRPVDPYSLSETSTQNAVHPLDQTKPLGRPVSPNNLPGTLTQNAVHPLDQTKPLARPVDPYNLPVTLTQNAAHPLDETKLLVRPVDPYNRSVTSTQDSPVFQTTGTDSSDDQYSGDFIDGYGNEASSRNDLPSILAKPDVKREHITQKEQQTADNFSPASTKPLSSINQVQSPLLPSRHISTTSEKPLPTPVSRKYHPRPSTSRKEDDPSRQLPPVQIMDLPAWDSPTISQTPAQKHGHIRYDILPSEYQEPDRGNRFPIGYQEPETDKWFYSGYHGPNVDDIFALGYLGPVMSDTFYSGYQGPDGDISDASEYQGPDTFYSGYQDYPDYEEDDYEESTDFERHGLRPLHRPTKRGRRYRRGANRAPDNSPNAHPPFNPFK